MNLPLVVNPTQFAAKTPESAKIVDVRSVEDFRLGHLPGAVHLDAALMNRIEKPTGGLLPDVDGVRLLANAIGLQENQHILVYDAGGASAAARLVWVMHAYGFDDISWLNGGFAAWQAAQLPVTTEVTSVSSSTVDLQFRPGNKLSVDELLASAPEPYAYLDVRSHKEYIGEDVRSERGGHVPGAVHSEWTDAFNADGTLKDDDTLRAMLSEMNLSANDHVVVYCQTHQRSALTYLVLKHLDFPKVSAIDGAWSAWGNRNDTPIENDSA